jgi:hypothetical protein
VFSILVQGLSIGYVVRHGVRDITQKAP